MIETKIYAHLSTTTAITVSSSVSTRIYPIILPQEVTYPAITYFKVIGIKENNLSGYSSMENSQIQIDCWTETYKEAKNLSTRVHSAMGAATAYSAILISDNDIYEDEVDVYRVSQSYSCWNRE